ncbi:MAG: hypothetical protein ABFE13_08775 [Phycisphaerales bacterium]
MSLPREFRNKVRAVQIRCGVNLFLRQAGRVLVVAGMGAVLAVLAERLVAVRVLTAWGIWSFWSLVAIAVLTLWVLRLPSRMDASLLLDERLKLSERFSTTLALAHSEDPFAKAARAESLSAVQQANLAGHFPIALSRSWAYGAGAWTMTVALVLLLPQHDLLGFRRDRQEEQKRAEAAQQAQTQVKKAVQQVKAAVRAMGEPNLVEDLKRLDELGHAAEPQEAKREAIKTLGDLAEKIQQMQAGAQARTADALQQMLKQLHGSGDPFSQQVRLALAKGDFSQAAKMLAQLQSQLNDGSLPEEKRKALAAQMQELGKELVKLSEQKRQIEEELAKLGLDKKLAQASPEQLRQALQKQGLNPEAVDELMKKVQAAQAASALCADLGQAMAGAAGGEGLSGEGLSVAADELDSLDAMQQQMIQLQVSLAEISGVLGGLGQRLGKSGHWEVGEGEGEGYGDGIGLTPGRNHAITSDALTANKMEKAASQAEGGPVVASWYFRDAQVKGEAQRTFTEVVQAGRASAAEAISENQIPRRYEDAVKTYFNQLEENGPQP